MRNTVRATRRIPILGITLAQIAVLFAALAQTEPVHADGQLTPTYLSPMSMPASASATVPAQPASVSPLFTPATSPAAPVDTTPSSWAVTYPNPQPSGTYSGPPGRLTPNIAYDSAHHDMVVFGGESQLSLDGENDTWIWNGTSLQKQLTGTACSALPLPRFASMMAYDAHLNETVLFGGREANYPCGTVTATGNPLLNDTWVWNGSSWAQQAPSTSPPVRESGTLVFDPATNTTLLIGGLYVPTGGGSSTSYNDMWSWDGTTWTQLHPTHMPLAEQFNQAAYDPTTQKVVLYQPPDGQGVLNLGASTATGVTWLWNGSDWSSVSTPIFPAFSCGMAYDPDMAEIVDYDCTNDDMWAYSGAAQQWTLVDAHAADTLLLNVGVPPAPSGWMPGLVYDPVGHQVLTTDLGDYATCVGIDCSYAEVWVWGRVKPPVVLKTVDRASSPVYARGETVTYTVTVAWPNFFATRSPISLTDTMPPGLVPLDGNIQFAGASCTAATTPSCIVNGQTLTVQGISLDSEEAVPLVYQAVASGVDRACSILNNAVSASNSAGSSSASAAITVCDAGLGMEKYWSYVSRPVGPQGTASVNVANGNLVLQQLDSTPIQGHGKFAYVLRRTYNSEDSGLLTFPGSIGKGWTWNLSDVGEGIGEPLGGGLFVPPIETVAVPAGITLVDRDGGRHTFTPRAVHEGASVVGGTLPAVGPLFAPHVLQPDPGQIVDIDMMYTAPAGVHLALWRYTEISQNCSGTSCAEKILGYAAERPDRLRMEFTADGRMVDMVEGNGNDLRYVYETNPPTGVPFPRLLQVYESRSCSLPLAATCRALTFSYPNTQTVSVTDPAARVTTYHLDTATPAHLTSVDNPDGSHLYYTYGGCGGTADQLCSATDPRGGVTKFAYGAVTLGPPRLAQLTDRDGNTTALNYSTADLTANLSADTGSERDRFSGIDISGRVGQIDQGTTADVYQRHATYLWDTPANPCVKPSGMVDNELCQMTVSSLAPGTPDQTTTDTYNEEGQMLTQSVATGVTTEGSLATTWGYHAQYFNANGTVQTYDDTVTGSGQVTSAGPSTGRTEPTTLFAISDRTQQLTARGNAAGSSYAQYLTTYLVDDNDSVDPNAVPPAAGTCSNPANPVADTGNVCQITAALSGSDPAVTRYTYDAYGQKATMTTPKAIAEGGATPLSYTYTYYGDADLDLSGNLSAGGWLKAVTDPYGRFALFAYDRAGNVVRSYERNATAGHAVTDALSSYGSNYSQTLHGSGATALSVPWRFLLSATDPLGNQTSFTVDANGNQTAIRPPRGNSSNVATYDITQTFDPNNNLLTHQTPAEASKPTKYAYDQFGDRSSATDPNGNVTVSQYDSVNRLSATVWTRGSWPASGAVPAPSACHDSVAADAPIPTGLITCSTTSSYDGEDNVIASQDGNHQTTTYTYDAAHRRQTQLVPRNDATATTLQSAWVYDADGNVTDMCPPNQFTLPAAVCNASSVYGTHHTYDASGHPLTTTSFRATGGAANTTTTNYDADGNVAQLVDANGHATTQTYDLTDRRLTRAVQRDAATTETTSWQYDPSGNVTAVTQPAGEITAQSYDTDNRLVDRVEGASSTVASQAGVTSPDGGSNIRSRLFYDQDGHIVAVLAPSAFVLSVSAPDASFMSRRDYDADGRPIAEYTPRFDGAAHSDLGLSSTQTSQCPTGVTPQQSAPNVPSWPAGVGVCTLKLQYDADGNTSQVTLPTSNGLDNRYVTYTYTNDNLVSMVCTPNPSGAASTCPGSTASPRVAAETTYYDADAKPVEAIDALNDTTLTSYYSDELVHQETGQPNGAVTHVATHTYDANGNETVATDPMGLATTTAYYTDNLVSSQTDPAGDLTSYTYDPAGNRISVMSPSANAHDTNNASGIPTSYTYTFDNFVATVSQPVSPTGSLRRETLYGYDASGRKTSEQIVSTDATGQQVGDGGTNSLTYFNDDRINGQSSSLGGSITTTYTPAGQPSSVADTSEGGSTLRATYYLDNSPRTVDDGSRTTQSTYDGLGSPAALATLVDGTSTRYLSTYSFGDAELPSSLTNTAVTGSGSTSWTYDAAGRAQKETDPSGVAATSTFNPDNTLASLVLTNSTGGMLANWSYAYDSDYRITQQKFSGTGAGVVNAQQSTLCYHYDAASRIDGFQMLPAGASCAPVPSTITHDHDGNRLAYTDPATNLATTYAYNADDSIASAQQTGMATPTLFTYTPAGALASDGCATNSYDGFNRLTQYQSSGAAGCPAATTKTYAYDGLDRQRSSGSTTVHFAGLGPSVAAETNGATDTAYLLDPDGRATGAAVENGSPAPQYLTDDGHGNIATTTNASQAVVCTTRFDPYGTPIGAASASNPCNTGSTIADVFFGGGRRDTTTGRYQLGSRTYDPGKASFLTQDSYRAAPSSADLSVGTDPLTENRYNYVNGDPVNLVDLNGHNPCSYEGTGSDGCSADQNRALAASDRGSDISGSPAPSGGRPRTYHSIPTHSTSGRSIVGPADITTRNFPQLSGADLAHRCALDPDCTVADFQAMSIDDRINWLDQFQRLYGTNGWFNDVRGVLRAFRDEHEVKPGNWYSYVDAATLTAINEGHAMSFGVAPSQEVAGSSAWSDFFSVQRSTSAKSQLRPAWGKAEYDAIHGADAVTVGAGIPRSPGAVAFTEYGDLFRIALQTGDTSDLRDGIAFLLATNDSALTRGVIKVGLWKFESDDQLLETQNEDVTYRGVRSALEAIADRGWR